MTGYEREIYLGLSAFDLAALACIGEAEDQGADGQTAVLSVIKNRHDLWQQDYQKVCLDPGQFECFDKEAKKLVKIAQVMLKEIIWPMTAVQTKIVGLAELILTGEIPSNVGKATFYKRHDAPSPWFDKQIAAGKFQPLKQIVDHVFYVEVKYVKA